MPGKVASSSWSDWKERSKFSESVYAMNRAWMARMSSEEVAGVMVKGGSSLVVWFEVMVVSGQTGH